MDLDFFKKSIPTLRFLVVFSIVGITVFYQLMSQEERLKIYNPIDINPRLVDISKKNLKKNHKISDFELINQNGEKITNKTYENKIYIADFFFTRCQSICIAMAYNMSELQDYYKEDDDIMFLSHSVTPSIDSSWAGPRGPSPAGPWSPGSSPRPRPRWTSPWRAFGPCSACSSW